MSSPETTKTITTTTTKTETDTNTARSIGISLLPHFILAGIYFLWGLGATGGLFQMLQPYINSPTATWPETDEAIVKNFTDIKPIDSWLSNLTPFFAHLMDGSDVPLSIFSGFMFGQYGVGFALVVMEGLRAGNKGRLVSFVAVFGLLMQTVGFAIIYPIYLLIHILTSPISTLNPGKQFGAPLLVSSANLAVLPLSLTLGYIIPSVLMILPSPDVTSISTRQKAIALWQAFPLWVSLTQVLLSTLYTSIYPVPQPTTNTNKTTLSNARKSTYLSTSGTTYTILLFFAILTHVPTLLLTILPRFVISELSPSLSSTLTASNVSFASVYIPHLPVTSWRAASLSEAVHTFLKWDTIVSSVAGLVWSAVLFLATVGGRAAKGDSRAVVTRPSLVGVLASIGFWTVVAGPFGALVILTWDRDIYVLNNSNEGEEKKDI